MTIHYRDIVFILNKFTKDNPFSKQIFDNGFKFESAIHRLVKDQEEIRNRNKDMSYTTMASFFAKLMIEAGLKVEDLNGIGIVLGGYDEDDFEGDY